MIHPPVLSAEDETRLATAIEAGLLAREALDQGVSPVAELAYLVRAGQDAFHTFVTANLRLVHLVANPVIAQGALDGDDIFQEGVLGLLIAVRRFDHTREARFATFAIPWIRVYVHAAAATRCGALGLNPDRARRWVRTVAARASLEQETGRPPSLHEVAESVGYPVRVVADLLSYQPAVRMSEHERFVHVAPCVAEETSDHTEEVARVMRTLSRQERTVIECLYGLAGRARMTFEQTAEELEVSVSTVRRRERSALAIMRERWGRLLAA